MSTPIKTKEDIRRDDEVEYLIKAVKALKEKTTAMQDIMQKLHESATKIAYSSTCDLKNAQELGQLMVHISSNQSYNLGMMNAELDSIKQGLKRVRSDYF